MIDAKTLREIAPGANQAIVASIAEPLQRFLPQYGIDTPLRQAHFLAQSAEESAGFKTLTEYATGREYEGRKDLGNINPGDGVRFKGRGIFQLTGRVNYRAYGKRIGIDLENNPELAIRPDICVRVACEYWKAKGLNAYADRDDINEITRRINGGYNGLAVRKQFLARAKNAVHGDDLALVSAMAQPDEEVPDAAIASEPNKPMGQSKIAWLLTTLGGGGVVQTILMNKGVLITVALCVVFAGLVAWGVYERWKLEQTMKPGKPPPLLVWVGLAREDG